MTPKCQHSGLIDNTFMTSVPDAEFPDCEDSVQKLSRTEVFKNHGSLEGTSDPPKLCVDLGETFMLETIGTTGHVYERFESSIEPPLTISGNPCTGPVLVNGVRRGDVIACHIQGIEPFGHTIAGTGSVLAEDFEQEDCDLIRLEQGKALFPGGVSVPANPMAGCIGVVPDPFPVPETWKHGGNMDITALGPGATFHVKAQRDGGWVCVGDCHAVQGEGEINGSGLEMASDVVISVDRSP